MNKNFRKVAFLAALSLTAVSCQKEIDVNPMPTTEQTTETINVVYYINGEVFRVTLNESEWDTFVERMLALAREGYEVSFSKNGDSFASQRKEKVIFTTNSEDEAHVWSNNMVNQGYVVTITFNKETGEYTCIAIK